MYACPYEAGRGFFVGVYASENRPVLSCDPPRRPAIREWLYASTPSLRILTMNFHPLLPHVVPSSKGRDRQT
jgi:hypothetical protein